MEKLMRLIIIIVVVGLTAGVAVQSLRVAKLNSKNQELQQQVAELQTRVTALESAPSTPANTVSTDADRTELLRLRNQAAQLRTATNELQKLRTQVEQLRAANQQMQAAAAATSGSASPAPPGGDVFPRESWTFAGYATPDAAFQSAIFAMSQGDYKTFLASLAPDEAKRVEQSFQNKTPEQISEEGRREMAKISNYRIMERRELSPDQTMLLVYASGEERVQRVLMQKVGDEWKMAGKRQRD